MQYQARYRYFELDKRFGQLYFFFVTLPNIELTAMISLLCCLFVVKNKARGATYFFEKGSIKIVSCSVSKVPYSTGKAMYLV